MRHWHAGAAILVGLLAATSAGAVIVLDGTWRAEGGGPGHEAAGFGAHIRLAHQPQFRALISFSSDGEEWGVSSGTWIGNDAQYAYVLTAAHVYGRPAKADAYKLRTDTGQVVQPDRVWLHPDWRKGHGDDDRTGYDFAIVRLPRPLTDLGPPPLLYAGSAEAGKTLTFVGFGSRGIGSVGQNDDYYEGSDKAAAQGRVDQIVAAEIPVPPHGDAGNYLGIYLPKEDGSIANPLGGPRTPVSRYAGLIGSGDSGGSAWLQIGGRWLIAGVNVNGSDDAHYGERSWFSRVSTQRGWIASVFPQARFSDGSMSAVGAAPAGVEDGERNTK